MSRSRSRGNRGNFKERERERGLMESESILKVSKRVRRRSENSTERERVGVFERLANFKERERLMDREII